MSRPTADLEARRMDDRARMIVAAGALVAVLAGGCGSSSPTVVSSPMMSPGAGPTLPVPSEVTPTALATPWRPSPSPLSDRGPAPLDPAWSAHSLTPPGADPASAEIYISGIDVIGGTAFAYGVHYQAGVGAVWRSTDGSAWTRGTGLKALDNPRMIAGSADGFVAIGCKGYEGCQAPLVWTSTDGLAWKRSVVDTGYGRGSYLTDIVRFDGRLLASGVVCWDGSVASGPGSVVLAATRPAPPVEPMRTMAGDPCRERTAAGRSYLWRSKDGRTWRPGPVVPDGARIDELVVVGDELLLVGRSTDDRPGTSRVWRLTDDGTLEVIARDLGLGQVSQVSTTPDGLIAFADRDGVRTELVRSDDGRTWELDLRARPPSSMERLVSAGGEDIIVGTVLALSEDEDLGGGVWVSRGGSPWQRVGDGPGFETAWLERAAVLGDRLLVAAADTIWTHPLPLAP